MIVTYRSNRLMPAIVITACIWALYLLIDPSIGTLRGAVQSAPEARIYKHHRPQSEDTTKSRQKIPPASSVLPEVDLPTNEPEHLPTPAAIATGSPVSSQPEQPTGNLTENDILLIMKTGATTQWKRLLIHLTTSLSSQRTSPENIVIYSDQHSTIGPFAITDALENITEHTKSLPEFSIYREQREYDRYNVYVEASGVAGDDWGPSGGWVIDKYKFVPLVQHAGRNWPKAKWYVYMEDDTYLFLPNVLRYLGKFDWREKYYLGHYSEKSDVVFAHGGAGFALSRGSWEASFGRNDDMSEEFEGYTAEHCCGDQVLAKALSEYEVGFGENGGDEKFTWGFNPLVHWATAFGRWNWCSPLMSWHKVHSRDVARYYELEKSWDFSKPLLYRDFFQAIIQPDLHPRVEWWDNQSGKFAISSANTASPPAPESKHDPVAWGKAWESVDACEAACTLWYGCIQWSYVEDLCKMDEQVTMGQGYAPTMTQRKTALKTTSGWMLERLERWKCN